MTYSFIIGVFEANSGYNHHTKSGKLCIDKNFSENSRSLFKVLRGSLSFAKATDSKSSKVLTTDGRLLKNFYTYILRNSQTNKYYIGFSPDLKNRLVKHKSDKVLSTKSNLNYELEWYCAFKIKKQALLFEKYLKTGSGIAFMKKRFFKSGNVALVKDNEQES